MRRLLCAALTALAVFCYAGDDDTPPPVDPPSCCGEGYTAMGVYQPPACGKNDTPTTMGEMGDVYIVLDEGMVGRDISGNGHAVEVSTGTLVHLYAAGGGDSDLCVQTSDVPPGACPHVMGCPNVSNKYKWTGDIGHVDPSNPAQYIFEPDKPGEYTITLESLEDGDCNVGGESKTTNTKIVVWEVRGIYPDQSLISFVPRSQSKTFSVEVEKCSPVPGYPMWSSTATTETNIGMSWGGEHAVSYILSVDVQASVTLPLNSVLVGKSMYTGVVVTKGRTFNCTPENYPKRYTVPGDYPGDSRLITDECTSICRTMLGMTWNYPFRMGDGQGEEMSKGINITDISSGPNANIAYIQDMDNVHFNIDTNTGIVFVTPSSTWYQNHYTTEIESLHQITQEHEERHYGHVVEAEALMDGQTTHPEDMYDQCEGIFGTSDNHEGLRIEVAGKLTAGISWIKVRADEFLLRDHLDDATVQGSDYYQYFCNPGRHCCYPPGCRCQPDNDCKNKPKEP